MPITPFLNGERFDLESMRVLGVAFEMVCIALRTGDRDDDIKQAIATKLIALVKAGERNPDRLCEEVVKDIRGPQQWAASEAAQEPGGSAKSLSHRRLGRAAIGDYSA